MSEQRSTVGQNLARLMAARQVGQTELSKLSGVSQASISRLLSGKMQYLRPEGLQALARALKTSVEALVSGDLVGGAVHAHLGGFRQAAQESLLVAEDHLTLLQGICRLLVQHHVLPLAVAGSLREGRWTWVDPVSREDLETTWQVTALQLGHAVTAGQAFSVVGALPISGDTWTDRPETCRVIYVPVRCADLLMGAILTVTEEESTQYLVSTLRSLEGLWNEIAGALAVHYQRHWDHVPWVDMLPEAGLVTGEGRVLALNDQAVSELGWPRNALLGRSMAETFAAQAPSGLQALWGQATQAGMHQLLGRRQDGSRFPLRVRWRPFVWARRPVLGWTVEDVTAEQRERTVLRLQHAALPLQSGEAVAPFLRLLQSELEALGVGIAEAAWVQIDPQAGTLTEDALVQGRFYRATSSELHQDQRFALLLAAWYRRDVRELARGEEASLWRGQPGAPEGEGAQRYVEVAWRGGLLRVGLTEWSAPRDLRDLLQTIVRQIEPTQMAGPG